MEDSNILKINRYLKGYDTNNRELMPQGVDVQTVVDYESETFKYGLKYNSLQDNRFPDPLLLFQDPLFPTFDIILDKENSPLLRDGINGLGGFLQDYSNIYSIARRQKIYEEFKKTLFTLFNVGFREISRNKSYYINNIAGLDKITARIVDFEKDKITINLNEDVSMISSYLTQLYNNLSYSYRDQRQMIPANLLRFNMFIKVHDVRNMPFYIPDAYGTGYTTSFDKSHQIYMLRDCTFDFRKTKDFDDTITVGGFEVGAPTKASSISIDIYYKSIEIESEFPLIMNSLTDEMSSALIINNKRSSVWVENDYRWNSIFSNNSKTPNLLATEIKDDSKFTNPGTPSQPPSSLSASRRQRDAKNNYRYNVVSSNTGNQNRTNDITGFEKKYDSGVIASSGADPKWDKNVPTSLPRVLLKKEMKLKPSNTEPARGWPPATLPTSAGSSPIWTRESKNFFNNRESVLDRWHSYDPSVYNANWNYYADGSWGQKPQTGPKLNTWRNSILGQENFENWIRILPLNIINFFFGSRGGMVPMYIDTSSRSIPSIQEAISNDSGRGPRIIEPAPPLPPNYGIAPEPDEPEDKFIPGSIINPGGTFYDPTMLNGESLSILINNPPALDGEIIEFTVPSQKFLDGEFIPYAVRLPFILDGEIISLEIPNLESLNGEYIPFTIRPPIQLDGVIDTSFTPKVPLEGVINTLFKVQPPLEGVIDTSFTPKDPLEGVIDTSFTPKDLLEGVIDTSFTPKDLLEGVIDTSFKVQPLLDGVIDASIKNREPLSGSIEISIIPREISMGTLYNNEYKQRDINLGLLYIGVNKENILPITYLYSKNEKFNTLIDYYLYNNVITESKSLNNLQIDQTTREITPFDLIYTHDNNVDILKTLSNVFLYNNNVEKIKNLEVINVIENIPIRSTFTEINLYENTSSIKILSENYLYNKTNINKNLEKEYLYTNQIVTKTLNEQTVNQEDIIPRTITNLGNVLDIEQEEQGSVNLGSLYEPSLVKKLLEPLKLFEVPIKKVIDLGEIYQNEKYRGNILIPNNEFVIKSEIEKKSLKEETIEQKKLDKIEIEKKYIFDENEQKEKEILNGDNITPSDIIKKEKQGLNNERIK